MEPHKTTTTVWGSKVAQWYSIWLESEGLWVRALLTHCVVSCCVTEENHLQENTFFDKVTGNVAQYPLHHVTYSGTKFEVATSNNLGGDAFTRKYIFDLNLGIKVTQKVVQYPLLHETYSGTKFEVVTFNGLWEYAFTKNTFFDLNLGVKVTWNVGQYPLHHVIYPCTKFEVATSNGLGGDTFTRNVTARQTDFGMKLIYPFCLKKKKRI